MNVYRILSIDGGYLPFSSVRRSTRSSIINRIMSQVSISPDILGRLHIQIIDDANRIVFIGTLSNAIKYMRGLK